MSSGQHGPASPAARTRNERIGFTQPLVKRQGIFDGISVAQLVAGAAAAATSVLFASKIGITGSVLGAAVSSVVTVVCSQLYRHALDSSAQKIKRGLLDEDLRTEYPEAQRSASGAYDDRTHAARVAPASLRARAADERASTQRKVVLSAIAIAVAAVAASALIILAVTAGEGLGDRPETILPVPAQTESDEGGDAAGDQADGRASGTDAGASSGNGRAGA